MRVRRSSDTRWFAVGLAVSGIGCAPVLSTFTPAAVTPGPLHFRGSLGVGASVPIGSLSNLADTLEASNRQVQGGGRLSQADTERLYNAVAGVILAPPGASPEAQARAGLGRGFDVGIRTTFGDFRVDGRYQILRAEAGAPLDLSVGLGLSWGGFSYPVSSVSDVLDIQDYRRLAAEVPVLAGWSGRFGAFWFGPKLLANSYRTSITVRVGGDETRALALDGASLYVGGQVGGMIGYRWIFLAAELTVMGMTGGAQVNVGNGAFQSNPTYGGVVVAPTVGLVLQI